MTKPRLIAYYLPQYHPIPENDAWWGEGFTEWTNVRKARPLFKGHEQPNQPGELGYYDLRDPAIREAQADLARSAGIEGFCYWYYWFRGKQLLERPFNEVLASGKPDYPFCLAWANHSWTGVWLNAPERVLIEQTYPGLDDNINHFKTVLHPAFTDKRYITVDNKPLLVVFRPADLPMGLPDFFRQLAQNHGFTGIHFVGVVKDISEAKKIKANGFDAYTVSKTAGRGVVNGPLKSTLSKMFGENKAASFYQRISKRPFHVYDYKNNLPFFDFDLGSELENFPAVMPNWDNSPRSGLNAHIWVGARPELFQNHLSTAIKKVEQYPPDHRIVIIKSWNEWAEGNYLEPDLKFGRGFLDAVKRELEKFDLGVD